MIPREETINELESILNDGRHRYEDYGALLFLYSENKLKLREMIAIIHKVRGLTDKDMAAYMHNEKSGIPGVNISVARNVLNRGRWRVKRNIHNHPDLFIIDPKFKKALDMD